GMELHPHDREVSVPNGHHLAVVAGRRDLENLRHARRRERVVAPGREVGRKAFEDSRSVMVDRARLSVNEPPRLADLSAEDLHDRLMAQADTQRRRRRGEPTDDLERRAGTLGTAGP